MTKEERLELLTQKKKWINENIRPPEDLLKFYFFVYSEIANEEQFVNEYPEMSDSFMLSRLKIVQIKLESARELMRKNQSKRAFDPFEMAFRHLNEDYDFVIGVFKSKNNL